MSRMPSWDGSSTGWEAYTPTLTNWTRGNGDLSGDFTVLGNGVVHYYVDLTLGSTTVASGAFSVSFPITPVRTDVRGPRGTALLFDNSAGASVFAFAGQAATNTNMNLFLASDGGFVTGVIPWTWASGDRVEISGTYQS